MVRNAICVVTAAACIFLFGACMGTTTSDAPSDTDEVSARPDGRVLETMFEIGSIRAYVWREPDGEISTHVDYPEDAPTDYEGIIYEGYMILAPPLSIDLFMDEDDYEEAILEQETLFAEGLDLDAVHVQNEKFRECVANVGYEEYISLREDLLDLDIPMYAIEGRRDPDFDTPDAIRLDPVYYHFPSVCTTAHTRRMHELKYGERWDSEHRRRIDPDLHAYIDDCLESRGVIVPAGLDYTEDYWLAFGLHNETFDDCAWDGVQELYPDRLDEVFPTRLE